MMKNIWFTNVLIFSQRLLTNLIDFGFSRENELNFREDIFKVDKIVKALGVDKINLFD